MTQRHNNGPSLGGLRSLPRPYEHVTGMYIPMASGEYELSSHVPHVKGRRPVVSEHYRELTTEYNKVSRRGRFNGMKDGTTGRRPGLDFGVETPILGVTERIEGKLATVGSLPGNGR